MATCEQLKCPYMEICSFLKDYRSSDRTNFDMRVKRLLFNPIRPRGEGSEVLMAKLKTADQKPLIP